MLAQISHQPGFIAALDQSGGSAPCAEMMFRLMHEMRVRIMTASAFTGASARMGLVMVAIFITTTCERLPAGWWMSINLPPTLGSPRDAAERNHARFQNRCVPSLGSSYKQAYRP